MTNGNKQDAGFDGIFEIIFALIGAALTVTAFVLGKFIRDPLVFLGVTTSAAATGMATGYATSALLFLIGIGFSGVGSPILLTAMIGAAAGTWLFLWKKCRPPAPKFNAIDECDKKTEFDSKMLCLGRKLEAIFQKAFSRKAEALMSILTMLSRKA